MGGQAGMYDFLKLVFSVVAKDTAQAGFCGSFFCIFEINYFTLL